MKRILGLDLGTASIGWALVNEAETAHEESEIIKLGVRVLPISTTEETDFQKGKAIEINANRTLMRGARRNLQRFKQRRKNLKAILLEGKIIDADFILAEDGEKTTHETLKLRAKAVTKKISLIQFAKILFAINKKRGYKSNRKAKGDEEGIAIDGMEIAKALIEKAITPGAYVYERLKSGKKHVPTFYPSDLKKEFDKIFNFQKQFYPQFLTDEVYTELQNKNLTQTNAILYKVSDIETAKLKGKRDEVKLIKYENRVKALTEQIDFGELSIVFGDINTQLRNTSGYLGDISDRSKELYFNKITVGQYLYNQIRESPHSRLKNQVFYRKDYEDEFDAIWKEQAKHHKQLTNDLKDEVKDCIIFYQRKLKSQKHLISICEFEQNEIEIIVDGKKKKKVIGSKVIPKFSPLFQAFKIWQRLNDITLKDKKSGNEIEVEQEHKQVWFEELQFKPEIKKEALLELIGLDKKKFDLNFDEVQGNTTNVALLKAFEKIFELEDIEFDFTKASTQEIYKTLEQFCDDYGIDKSILKTDTSLDHKAYQEQKLYQFLHLIYSLEENETIVKKLKEHFGIAERFGKIFANLSFQDDYGSLSAKALRNILPHLKAGVQYDKACVLAGYNHSSYETKEDLDNKMYDDFIDEKLLKKNSLRNPIVEKILYQMIHLVNAVIDKYGKPDEIRVELSRDLKKNAKERKDTTDGIAKAAKQHEKIRKVLETDKVFNLKRVTRNDIIKYKLWMELKNNGFKTLYTNKEIPPQKLFTKEVDVEHIIPRAKLFDDSFANKTLSYRSVNLEKSNLTAYDYLENKLSEDEFQKYINRVDGLHKSKDKDYPLKKSKLDKLKMKGSEIPDGFIERDLRNSQYIAKKALSILKTVVRDVYPTIGKITNRLRLDWGLVEVMKELNFEKYELAGLTYTIEGKNGETLKRIKDWTKRNDHRHHAMDALAVAFTKNAFVQYLNNKNAESEKGKSIYGIVNKHLYRDKNGKQRFVLPMKNMREEAKKHLESVLISYKANNKVVTQNLNKIKSKEKKKPQPTLTPRGQLHNETVYGYSKFYKTKEEKVGSNFDKEKIESVAQLKYRNALLNRLAANEDNPKKAFTGKNSLDKNPIYVNNKEQVPVKVKTVRFEDRYTKREPITPELKIDKVIDVGIRRILENRLADFDGDKKKAFSNLEENPVWLNKASGIKIRRVKITGKSNVEPLHHKKDHLGKDILDEKGNRIPTDFVSTGNNHHVAIYKDKKGNLQEEVVSFFEAVARVNAGLPIIEKNHPKGWAFLFTMKQNEFFVFETDEFKPKEIDLLNEQNFNLISPHLFRVQKISTKNYLFNHHYNTTAIDGDTLKNKKALNKILYYSIRSTPHLKFITKVRLNNLGAIVQVGEY